MNRKPLVAAAYMLCVPIAILFVHASFAADTSADVVNMMIQSQYPKDALYVNNIETSAECEKRLGKGTTSTNTSTMGTLYDHSQTSCRSSCQKITANKGYTWYGTAPFCGGDKMDENATAYKNCKDAKGTPVDWSYCGDGKTCSRGTKILCQNPAETAASTQTSPSGSKTITTYRYYGKPPFCNAKSVTNMEKCANAQGDPVGEVQCPPAGEGYECCKTGKYLKCKVTSQVSE